MNANLYAKISAIGRVEELILPGPCGELPAEPKGVGWFAVQWPTSPHFTGERLIVEMIEAGWAGREPVAA